MIDRIKGNFTPFKQGEQVWLDNKNLCLPYENQKLSPKREGPFKIKKVLGPLTYELDLPKKWKIHPVFHASLLRCFIETDAHGPNYPGETADLADGETEYDIEAILDSHKPRDRRIPIEYLI